MPVSPSQSQYADASLFMASNGDCIRLSPLRTAHGYVTNKTLSGAFAPQTDHVNNQGNFSERLDGRMLRNGMVAQAAATAR